MDRRVVRVTACSLAILAQAASLVFAEVVELRGTVKQVDADARTLQVERSTASGRKMLKLDVARQAGDLTELKAGDEIAFSYDPEVEVVLKISPGIADTGSTVREFPNHKAPILAVAFTPNGKSVLAGVSNRMIWTWSTEAGSEKLAPVTVEHVTNATEKPPFLTAMNISPDGRMLASALSDGSVQLWEAVKSKWVPWQQLDTLSGITTPVLFSGDSKTLATVERNPGVVRLWDVTNTKVKQTSQPLAPPGVNIWSIAFAPNNQSAFVGVFAPASKIGQVVEWQSTDGPRVKRTIVDGLASVPRSVSVAPDGNTLAVGDNGLVRLYSLESREPISVLDTNKAQKAVVRIAFSPDGSKLVTGGYYSEVAVWDVATGRSLDSLDIDGVGEGKGVEGLAFSPDGETVAIGSKDGILRLWRFKSRSPE